jgi:hypothetical protein
MKVACKLATLTSTALVGIAPFAQAARPAEHPGRPSITPSGPPVTVPVGPPSSAPAAPSTTLPSNPGTGDQASTPGPGGGLPAKAKAYGAYCHTEGKRHLAGTHGTPFSNCVTAMAALAAGSTTNQRSACKDESKKHVSGIPGSPFSICVSAGAKLLEEDASE